MEKADVSDVDESAAAACNASRSQPQDRAPQTGTQERSLREDGDIAALSASSAAGADRASGAEILRSAEDPEQAGAEGKDKVVVGYWREHSTLTHVVIRNAGHMVCPFRLLLAPHSQVPDLSELLLCSSAQTYATCS